MNAPTETVKQLAIRLEGFETPKWCIDAILDVEMMSGLVWDPCTGKGVMAEAAKARGHAVIASDIYDWGYLEYLKQPDTRPRFDFLEGVHADLWREGDFVHQDNGLTVFMNPPFSKAEAFVEKAHEIGARKIICFQRFSWYEGERDTGKKRGQFWEKYPPNRIYICGSRATCWRFDIPEEERKSGTTTAHAWFIWERGHPQGTLISHIWKGSRHADRKTG